MIALLIEIRDEARAQTAYLRATAAAQGVDLEPEPEQCPFKVNAPGYPRCTRPRRHLGPCMGVE